MATLDFDTYAAYRTPIVVMRINGSAAADLSARVISMKYVDNHKIGGKKKGTRVDKMELDISDPRHELTADPRFDLHARWDVRWGYPQDMSDARWFLLAYYEPVYDVSGAHIKKVTLLGSGITLTTMRSARNWGRVSSSEIAAQIAKRHGLRASIDATHDRTETAYLQPVGQSDFEFLNELAADVDFEFFVENDLLVYRSRDTAYNSSPRVRLVYGAPNSILVSFKPTLKVTPKVVVGARGVDTATGSPVQPKVSADNVGGVHLGKEVVRSISDSARAVSAMKPGATGTRITSGDQLVKKIDQLKRDSDVDGLQRTIKQTAVDLENGTVKIISVPDSASAIVKTPETNAQKVGQITKARQRDFLESTVEAHMECIGTPKIRAKANFNIVLPDPRLTGPWYAVETTHTINDKSYRVTAKLHRGALSSTSAPASKTNRTDVGKKGEVTDAPKPVVKIDLESGRVTSTGVPQPGTR